MSQPHANPNQILHKTATDWYQAGEQAICDGKIEQAVTCYQKATQLDSNFSWAYHKLGDSLSELKRWQPAIQAYRQAIELKPDFFWSYYNLGKAFSQIKQWQEAITYYIKAINIQSDFCWSFYDLGKAFSQKQQWQDAVEAYIQADKLQQNLPGLYRQLGQVFNQQAQQGLKSVILQYYRKLKTSKSASESLVKYYFSAQDLPIYIRLSQALIQEKYFLGAIILYQIALAIQPEDHQTNQQLKQALFKQAEIEKQIITAQQAVVNSPYSHQAYYELGVILSRQQQWISAISAYFQAIQLQPEQPSWLYQELWDVLAQQGRLEEAVKLYRNAVARNPHSVWCYVNLGEILTYQGNIQEAIQCYQAAAYQKIQQFHPEWMNQINQLIPVEKPNFLIIGTQKGGTTSLYYYLAQHPQIVPSLIKEIEFWSHKYERGLDWYLAHFLPQLNNKKLITGEATPSYLNYQGVAQRIAQVFPEIKIIILLRNPVNRAISHYYQWFNLKWESRSLPEAIQAELNQPRDSFWNQPNSYLARGVYIEFIKEWMSIFPPEQLLILKSEEFYENPAQILSQVYSFLNLPSQTIENYKPYNSGSYSSIDIAIIQQLQNYFKPYNNELEEFLKTQFNWD